MQFQNDIIEYQSYIPYSYLLTATRTGTSTGNEGLWFLTFIAHFWFYYDDGVKKLSVMSNMTKKQQPSVKTIRTSTSTTILTHFIQSLILYTGYSTVLVLSCEGLVFVANQFISILYKHVLVLQVIVLVQHKDPPVMN
jgi:bacteriorhodopsin